MSKLTIQQRIERQERLARNENRTHVLSAFEKIRHRLKNLRQVELLKEHLDGKK